MILFFRLPATADNMVQKTYIQTLWASFAPGTLSGIAGNKEDKKMKKTGIFARLLGVIFLSLLLLTGCGGGGGGGGGESSGGGSTPNANQPVTFSPGNDVTVTSKVIAQTGGTIEAGNSGTPIDGVQVQFPAGALPADTNVSLGYNTGTLTPNEGTYAGVALVLNTGAVTQFDQPVTIIVPFTDTSKVPVPYYVDSTGKLHPAQLITIDRTAKTFTFQTFHASWFTWIFGLMADTIGIGDENTGYSPGEDGFQVVNNGSEYNREGECFGMTSFSLWYFMDKKASKGKFYPKYYNIVGTDASGNSLRGQDIIATRAFISIAQQWTSYYSNIVDEQLALTQEDRYASIVNIIQNTRNPVLIYLYHTDRSNRGAHSVLAYAFNNLSGRISIYDPIYPGQEKTITYDKSTKAFNSYSGYDGIIYNGDGSLHLTESYQNILDDADANFQSSGNATINVTSHTNGQQVTERNITLSGNIQSGQVLVTKLKVFVGSTPFSVNVGSDGSFSLTISLERGINYLQFVTEGNDASGRLIQVPNNMATVDFTINLNIPTAAILVTLTWDTNDTDVDLYVIDPTGDYSCYYHMITTDGGELDHDIITGYGPEHWTLMTTDTVRYDQPYKVRLHYYSDHGNGPTNYTASIKLYEGTSREQEYWYRGNLAVSNPDNDAPNDSGSDWVDIADITLTQTQSASRVLKSMQVSNGNIKITVPVPSKEKRIKGGL